MINAMVFHNNEVREMTEPTKFEWQSFDEHKVLQEAQKKLEDQLKIEALEKELKDAWQRLKRHQQVLILLQEAEAVSHEAIRKAHEFLNEVERKD